MVRKIALKQLTASDLTFFKWHYEHRPAGKQKAFNLDSKILVGEFFPYLGEPSDIRQPRFPLDLYLFGPGLAPVYNLQRKILKQQKNWRLNGEFVDGPEDDVARYNVLKPDDFAFFEFYGDTEPKTAKVALIAQGVEADAAIHAELLRRYGRGSMWAVTESEIRDVLDVVQPLSGHPLYDWIVSGALEDAALGGAESREKLANRRGGKGVSPEEFALVRKSAELVGILGEEKLNDYFLKLESSGKCEFFEWTSSLNAIAPFDFRCKNPGEEWRVIDAKSTSGSFSNPIHMSLSEVRKAVEGPEPYDIYRLYEVTDSSAKLRVAAAIGPHLADTLAIISKLPNGIQIDGISIPIKSLPFAGEEIILDDETE